MGFLAEGARCSNARFPAASRRILPQCPLLLALLAERSARGVRQHEVDATILVVPFGGWQVEIGERNFLGARFVEYPNRLADDGVILHFLGVAVA